MEIKELLLNGKSFNEILRQFAVNQEDVMIKDEEVLFKSKDLLTKEILRERILIQGKNGDGVVNFFGTLHCNLLNKLAVFELDEVEKLPNVA